MFQALSEANSARAGSVTGKHECSAGGQLPGGKEIPLHGGLSSALCVLTPVCAEYN